MGVNFCKMTLDIAQCHLAWFHLISPHEVGAEIIIMIVRFHTSNHSSKRLIIVSSHIGDYFGTYSYSLFYTKQTIVHYSTMQLIVYLIDYIVTQPFGCILLLLLLLLFKLIIELLYISHMNLCPHLNKLN